VLSGSAAEAVGAVVAAGTPAAATGVLVLA
jgi:hypothetical protein